MITTEISKFEIRETIDNVPVKFTVYPAGARMGNHVHSFMSPADSFTFFIVGEVDTTGMTDAEFFRSPLAVFEAVSWTGYTNIDTHELLLDSLRKEARRDIANRLPYTGKLELESIAQAGQIEALNAQVHELRQAICFTYGYLEFNWDAPSLTQKRLLNRLYDAARMERLTNIEYFYEADEAPLLPGGDLGMFPAAHQRQQLDAEYSEWADSLPATHEDATRTENAGGGNPSAVLDCVRSVVDTAERIEVQAHVPALAAQALAEVVLKAGCKADRVFVGGAFAGYSTVVYAVFWQQQDGRWHSVEGEVFQGAWRIRDVATHHDLKTLRWFFTFVSGYENATIQAVAI